MNDIKDFRIGKASYTLENDKGSKLLLILNYANNTFVFKILKNGKDLLRLEKQAGIIAEDMLSRKAQKNLNYKLLQLNNKK